jgi:hypothetical protein
VKFPFPRPLVRVEATFDTLNVAGFPRGTKSTENKSVLDDEYIDSRVSEYTD